jgi:hypothetical protein
MDEQTLTFYGMNGAIRLGSHEFKRGVIEIGQICPRPNRDHRRKWSLERKSRKIVCFVILRWHPRLETLGI